MADKFYMVVITPKDENDTSIEIDTRSIYTMPYEAWESLKEYVLDQTGVELHTPRKLDDYYHDLGHSFISVWRSDISPSILHPSTFCYQTRRL